MKNMSQKNNVRVRFAPSPTGLVHLGGLRTALYNYLYARQHKGAFILRIEDTDQGRLVPGAMQNIIQTLTWAGLDFDEGPEFKGDEIVDKGAFGPYEQSKRLDTYRQYAHTLIDSGNAYPCFCTSSRLDQMRKEQMLKKEAPRYDGTCRDLPAGEVARKRGDGVPEVVRMKVPHAGITSFVDEVHGAVEFKNDLLDDQVLMKSDGFPTYHLAVVVDDHLMGITHVIRGEDWLPSTPKHLLLYQFFGWDAPCFAHIPLLLAAGGGKLSKRDMSSSVFEYQQQGYLKDAVLNFVALLGWHPKGDNEILSMDELIKKFDLHDVNTSGAIFMTDKLDYLNGLYIRRMKPKEFAAGARPYLEKAGLITPDFTDAALEKVVVLEQSRIKKLTELPEALGFMFSAPKPKKAIIPWKKQSGSDAAKKLTALSLVLGGIGETLWRVTELENAVKGAIAEAKEPVGETLWPMRVSLSGREASPGPFELATALGKIETLHRIKTAISILES